MAGDLPNEDVVKTDETEAASAGTAGSEAEAEAVETTAAGSAGTAGSEAEAEAVETTAADTAGSEEERVAVLERELAAARADFYNYRQRILKDRNEQRRRILEDTVQMFFPVIDNLDRALMVPSDGSAKSVLVGVEMVRRQFLMLLEEMGITVVPTKGVKFDPLMHDAIVSMPVDDPEQDNVVLDEQMRGYRTKDRVLRAAQVSVGRASVTAGVMRQPAHEQGE